MTTVETEQIDDPSAEVALNFGSENPTPSQTVNPKMTGRSFWSVLRSIDFSVVLSVVILVIVVLWALIPDIFTSYDPIVGVPSDHLQSPNAQHWFGTDATGRDLFSRTVYGARESLLAALIAVAVGLTAGTTLGVLAGSVSGFVDDIIMRIVDILLSIPGLLLALSVVIVLGFGTTNIAIAVGVTSVASFARLSRSEVVRVRRSDYVEAAFGSGGRFLSVLARHVLPNSLTAVLALAALQLGTAILALSTFGYLGFGAPPPTPEWGLLIAEGHDLLSSCWWLTTLPGLIVVLVVLSANRISAYAQSRNLKQGT